MEELTDMSEVELQYQNFISGLKGKLGKIDPSFALELMRLQNTLKYEKPLVTLQVCYDNEVDLEKKRIELDKQFACISTSYITEKLECPDAKKVLKVQCLANLETILELSKDKDIKSINAEASLGSF